MAHQSLELEKPKLPDLFRQALESKNYALGVDVSFGSDCDDSDARTVAHRVEGIIQITLWDSEESQLGPIEIGRITGWRTLSFSVDEVIDWSDRISQEVYDAFVWLLTQQTVVDQEDVLFSPVLFVEKVAIEPMWRGQGLTLPAIATFLDVLLSEFVFFYSLPVGRRELSPQQYERMSRLLKQYWRKLGFKNYDQEHDLMWTEIWRCPEWLRPKE